MNDNDAIINKIKKLFALSNSPNEAEASSAMEKAHQLLKDYNISLSSITEDNRFSIVEEAFITFSKERKWRTLLVSAVCKANYCASVKLLRGSEGTLSIVGKEHNVISTKIMAEYLISTIERLSKKVTIVKNRESYKLGVVNSINQRLSQLHKEDMTNCTALVVQESAAVEQYLKEGGITKELVTYKANNRVAYYNGQKDGMNISLNQQINGNMSGSMIERA